MGDYTENDVHADSSCVNKPLHHEDHDVRYAKSSKISRKFSSLVALSLGLVSVDAIAINGKSGGTHFNQLSSGNGNALALLNEARKIHKQRSKSKVDGVSSDLKDNRPFRIRKSFLGGDSNKDSWKNLFDGELSLDQFENLEESPQDAFISSRVEENLPSINSFRTSLGSDIPDMELQLQVEAAKVRAMARGNTSDAATIEFMDLHHEQKKKRSINTGVHHDSRGNGPSAVEMVAMSAMPSQLPELATSVLNRDDSMHTSNVEQKQRLQRNTRKSTATRNTATDAQQSRAAVSKIPSKNVSTIMKARKAAMESSNMQHHATSKKSLDSNRSGRVSHEEELQLARIIQRGVELHNIKSKFENENGRDITRQEWAELAKLESPKQLRRLVSDYRKAKNKLVMANMGLVHAVVRARMGMSGSAAKDAVGKNGISYEEMVQEGSLGLLRAAELFDPSRGLRFSTYATIWIKGVLGNSNVSDTISVPLREKTKYNKIQTSIADLQMEFGANDASYKPTDEEISERSGIDVETVKQVMRKMRRAKNVLSLDYQYETKGRSGVVEGEYEALSNDKNLMDDVDLVERLHVRADVIAAIVRNLDPREARLIRLRYGLNDGRMRTIKDCAEAMGISQARAQQLAAGCLKKLREADDAESLQEYLLSVA
ncbi:hypothetical protein CTEN210_15080 [Chaetoceros tenuissimus]|uniref:RNA polymerase sigma-70 domain-containing protein n=1 Tax=Chaetoceros tenuissimus TaxID=426638 RepID=A0AAD3D9N1_9STRA|nr:hypothetical protein CTEN210_15080 [Chaetoceros tenuissimus]